MKIAERTEGEKLIENDSEAPDVRFGCTAPEQKDKFLKELYAFRV